MRICEVKISLMKYMQLALSIFFFAAVIPNFFFHRNSFSGPDGMLEEDVVDEEEFRLMKKVREAKKSYRAAYEDLANIQGEMESVAKETSALKSALLSTFEEWHASALADAQPRDPFGDTRGGEEER